VNQPSPTVAAPAAPAVAPSAVGAVSSYEARVAAVNSELDAAFAEANPTATPGDAAPADVPVTDALTASVEVDPAVAAAAAASTPDPEQAAAAQRAEDRRLRLAALSAKTRDQVDRKAAAAATDKLARDYQAAVKRAEDAEKAASSRIDVSSLDAKSLLGLAEQKGIKPDELIRFISEAMTSPEKVAEAAALQATRTTYDPKLAAYEARLAKQDEQIAQMARERAEEKAAAQEHQATQQFLGMVSQSGDRAPLAARLLATDPEEFMSMANIAAPRVAGMGAEALLDAVEDLLDGEGRKLAQKYATLYGPQIPSQPSAPVQPTTRGAAKPNTVSNSLAQGRTALVDDDGSAGLTLEERAARIIRAR
jgi:hypothetical protein